MMHDPAFDVLLPFLQQHDGKTLWIADENALSAVDAIAPYAELAIVSNRFDVVAVAKKSGHIADFSDFDLSLHADGSVQRIIYRISKEKPVVHHVLNHAYRLLAVGGKLLIAGLKTDGTKTYVDKCRQIFGNGNIKKSGQAYLGSFGKISNAPCVNSLEDQNYSSLRIIHTPSLDFYSKPGLFGWDRIDQGSEFLLETLPDVLANLAVQPQSLLDIGCGYGYLTLMTRHLPLLQRVATDNNAAALLAMQRNADYHGINVEVVADDAGQSLSGFFDLVLCNPPFHQGFSVAGDLTEKFLRSARRLLSTQGTALFVVNTFIGIEKKAVQHFSLVKVLANNGSFKLVLLRR
ncbi:MAG TPA: methyltransferase [Pseudomonadales bacterium]|nr:methyltransferase [Pseudomonadales bacterium]